MGYFQSTDRSSIQEATHLGAAQKSERSANLTAVARAAQPASLRALDLLDRVTLSPAADALAQVDAEQGPASPQRLSLLREAVRANALPIYPTAIAESILRDESHGQQVEPAELVSST